MSEWIVLQVCLYAEDTPKLQCEGKTGSAKNATGSAELIFQPSAAERRWSGLPPVFSFTLHDRKRSPCIHVQK